MISIGRLVGSLGKQLCELSVMASSVANNTAASSLLRPAGFSSSCTQLVKDDFSRSIELKALPIPTAKLKSCINAVRKLMPGFVKLSCILDGHDDGTKLVLLDPQLLNKRKSLLTEAELNNLAECGANLDADSTVDQLETRSVNVTYEHYPMSAVFDSLMPPDTQLSSFSLVGHIAHFNLKEALQPFGPLIGQVLISKLSNIKTVVSKRRQISSEYRNFELELLAGEPNYVTLHKEFGLEFELDFSKVYWNSRLSTEHRRVVSLLRPGDLVFDLCAGVGPFAVPALKLGAAVYANDLNPTAHRYLEANLRRNLRKSQLRSQPDLVKAFNLDARQFVAQVFVPTYAEAVNQGFKSDDDDQRQVVAIANLPGLAVDLLDSFVGCLGGLLSPSAVVADAPPVRIFAYSFLRRGGDAQISRQEAEAALIDRIRGRLAGGVQPEDVKLRFVRDVATSKDMYCAEIRCPASVLLADRPDVDGLEGVTETKKARLE